MARGRVLPALAVAAVCTLAPAACATLPSESAPAVIDNFSPKNPERTLPAPAPGTPPADIIHGFLQAGGLGDQRHDAARQYLSPAAAAGWDDAVSTTILLRAEVVQEAPPRGDAPAFHIRGEKVGTLDTGGVFRAGEGRVESRLEMTRVDGQWRIDSLPPGVLLERSEFFSDYARRDLYFLDRSGRQVVPDTRWTATYQSDLESTLVNLLVTGPRAEMVAGVETSVPPTISVRARERDAGVAGTTIDFQGLPSISTQATQQFAAQVVWTLADAQVPGPYRLERDGSPLDERHSSGWTIDDVSSYGPARDAAGLGFALTPADGLVRTEATGSNPAGGAWSSLRSGRTAALSADGSAVAVVTGPVTGTAGTRQLQAGTLSGTPRTLARGDSFTAPSWDSSDGSVWTVQDGTRPLRITTPVSGARTDELDPAPLRGLGGPVTEFRLGQTGTRVVLVAGSRAYVGTIAVQPDGPPAITSIYRIGQSLGDTITTAAWLDRGTVVLGRDTPEAPVATVTVDGAMTEPLSQRNITAPVSAVAVAGTHVYAVDGRGLVTLDTAADTATRYWQDVPGLAAIRAYPVARG